MGPEIVFPHLREALNTCEKVVALDPVVLAVLRRDVVDFKLNEQLVGLCKSVRRCNRGGTHF